MPTRRDVLMGTAGLVGAFGLSSIAAAAQTGKNLVVINADGGWDPTFTIDPKPGIDGIDGPYVFEKSGPGGAGPPTGIEEIGTYGAIDVTLNDLLRPEATRFFESFGSQITLIRGLWIGSVSHPVCRRRLLTGSDGHGLPDFATIVGKELGVDKAVGVVDMAGTGWFGPYSRLAARKGDENQLTSLLDPSTRFPLADGSPRPNWQPQDAERSLIEQWIADRAAIDSESRPWRAEHLSERAEARSRGDALARLGPEFGTELRNAVDFAGQVPLVVEMLKSGACSSVVLDTQQPWDSHFGQDSQHSNWDNTLYGVGLLLTTLQAEGLWDDTVVVVASEMARTPKRNPDGGTDHWPYTAAMIAGGGVRGGHVCGGSDDGLVGFGVDLETGAEKPGGPLLSYSSFVAGILESVGVEPEPWLPGVQPLRGFRG